MKEPYNRVTVNGKRVRAARVVWDTYHPDNLVKKGEVIHHKDGNKRNDNIENLEKMADSMHRSTHAKYSQPLKNWGLNNVEVAKEVHTSNAYSMLNKLKADPKRFREWREKQREGTIKANKARAGEKRSQEYKESVRKRMLNYWREKRKEVVPHATGY